MLFVSAANAALPALFADSESRLPACCRRTGNHHCSMMPAATNSPGEGLAARSQKCSRYPAMSVSAHIEQAAPPTADRVAWNIEPRGAARAQAEALYRISHSRAREKRGPPLLS